jgi:hypothetical protein
MSPIALVLPHERVDRTTFSGEAEYLEHRIHVGSYTCPECNTVQEFNTSTLRSWEAAQKSPFGPEWQAACDAVRARGSWEWAFDFSCRGCHRKRRIVYAHDGEWAMGEHRYRIAAVLEGP